MSAQPALPNDPDLTAGFADMALFERLAILAIGRKNAVFTTSLGIEDQVLTVALCMAATGVRIVTLETGRLFPETLALIDETEQWYDINIERLPPNEARLAVFVERYGHNGFYDSIEARSVERPRGSAFRRVGQGKRPDQGQPTGRLDDRRHQRFRRSQRRADQSAARSRLPLDRLRTLNAGHQARRGRARRALVVGERPETRVRPACERRTGEPSDHR